MDRKNIPNVIVIIGVINWVCAILFTFFKGIPIFYFSAVYFIFSPIPAAIGIIIAMKLLFDNQYIKYRKNLIISLILNIVFLIVFASTILFMFTQTA